EVAEAAPAGERWLQLYVFRDRGVSDELVRVAVEHGYEAIVVTVDLPVLGVRDRDVRTQYAIPEAVAGGSASAMGRTGSLRVREIGELIDPTLTWGDIARLVERSELPVLVKGVLTPEDARLAADHGVAGVVVSNHGG